MLTSSHIKRLYEVAADPTTPYEYRRDVQMLLDEIARLAQLVQYYIDRRKP